MNKKIVYLILLLTVVSLVGIPSAMGEVAKQFLPFHSPTPTETHTPKPTVTHIKPTETHTPKPTVTHTPKPTVTKTPTPVPEYPSMVLPIAAVMGLMMLLLYRRRNN